MATIDRRGVSVDATDTPIVGDPNPGLAWKAPVLAATTANIVLSGVQTVDGVVVGNNNERVLVWQQTDQTTNGLYSASSGSWTRTVDLNGNDKIAAGLQVIVTAGTQAGTSFQVASSDPIVIGTSNIVFQGSSPMRGPVTSLAGNIAFFSDITGKNLSAQPAFHAANPSNAALYAQLTNPVDGYTTDYNGLQFSIGTPLPAAEQFGNGGANGNQQAIVGTVQSSAGDSGNIWGVVGYAKANSALTNAVGVGGYGKVNVANGNAWGGNLVVHNMSPVVTNGGFDTNWMSALELDVNVWKKAGGVNPTNSNIFGLYIFGGGDSTKNEGSGVAVAGLSVVTGAKFTNGFISEPGASVNAFVAGPSAKTGNNVPSQPIIIQETDGSGNVRFSRIESDGLGDLIIQSPVTGAGCIQFGDTSNATYLTVGAVGGAKVQINSMAAAGIVTNTSTGVLNTTPTGTGVQTALGNGANAAGGFVTSPVANANLANASITINSTSVALGGSITIGAAPTGVAGGDLTGTYPNPTLAGTITAGGPTGSATVTPIITYDAKGRLTAVTSATITPAIGSITGLGTGIATALGVNVGTAGAPVVNGGAGGTPASLTLTNATGLPVAGGGTGNTSAAAEQARLLQGVLTVTATAVNFNSANTDTALSISLPAGFSRCFIFRTDISHASASLSSSTFGVFTTTGGGGTALITTQACTVTTASDATVNNMQTVAGNAGSVVAALLATPNTIYFRVVAAEGSPATADVSIQYIPLP